MASGEVNLDEADPWCRRRGRPRSARCFSSELQLRCFAPQCSKRPVRESVRILPEELELLRLVDLEGLDQERAAAAMGVSRKTAWRDLHEARRKIADALISGKVIEMAECKRRLAAECPEKNLRLCPKENGGFCPLSNTVLPDPDPSL